MAARQVRQKMNSSQHPPNPLSPTILSPQAGSHGDHSLRASVSTNRVCDREPFLSFRNAPAPGLRAWAGLSCWLSAGPAHRSPVQRSPEAGAAAVSFSTACRRRQLPAPPHLRTAVSNPAERETAKHSGPVSADRSSRGFLRGWAGFLMVSLCFRRDQGTVFREVLWVATHSF